MGARRWKEGMTSDPVGASGARGTDRPGPISIPGIAGQTTWGIACDICGKGHDPALHAPSTDALRSGLEPSTAASEVLTDRPDDYIDYDPKPVAYYNDGSPYYGPPHPDDHLFAEDWDDIERAQRAARRASLAELGSGPMRPVP